MSAGSDKLDRFLSKAGALSREQAKLSVKSGDVSVNGRTVTDPWTQIRVGHDVVKVKGLGQVILPDWVTDPPSIVLFNKPAGVVVTMATREEDPLLQSHQSTLREALPAPWRDLLAPHVPALRPVGRLDAPSVGLLVMTNSSGLAAKLTTPGLCEKEYLLRVNPVPDQASLIRLRSGVDIDDKPKNSDRGQTQPCDVTIVESGDKTAVLRFTIREGRNRQLRRMCSAVGLTVEWLLRVRVGPIRLGDLAVGAARAASPEELRAVFKLVGEGGDG